MKSSKFLAWLALSNSLVTAAPLGTAFTYQGQLTDGSAPANGSYDLKLRLYDAGGMAVSGPITNSPVAVTNGLFTTTLDFGANAFTGDARWLEIQVRPSNGAGFTILTPRQPLTPSPYALYAGQAAMLDGLLPASQLSGLYPSALTLTNAGNSFSGDGAGLTALNAAQLTTGTVPLAALSNAWKLGGNTATTAGLQFLGTTDNQPLEFKVNSLRTARLESAGDSSEDANTLPDGAPNVILGAPVNFVATGAVGATIAGGGATNYGGYAYTNSILASYGALGGGLGNRIALGAFWSTITGGIDNDIGTNSDSSFIGGGDGNNVAANSWFSTIAGGQVNGIGTDSDSSFIGGGYWNNIGTNSSVSAIGGGWQNRITDNSSVSTIAGGSENTIGADAYSSIIGGGYLNNIGTNSFASAIGGGGQNNIADNSWSSTIAGGEHNTIGNNSYLSAIGGGYLNNIGTNSHSSAIGGGGRNNIADNSWSSTIAGGENNRIGTNSFYGVIGGGNDNNIAVNSPFATIPGGQFNVATNYAFAAGRQAKAFHTGAFVWADTTDNIFPSRANNEFAVRAAGGVRLETGGAGLKVDGNPVVAGLVQENQIAPGAVTNPSLADNAVTTRALADGAVTTGKILNGTIELSDLSVPAQNAFWHTAGNAGTTTGLNFLGTTDNQPLEIKVNSLRAARIEFAGDSPEDRDAVPDGAPNVILGSPVNFVVAGAVGATIAGGGATNYDGSVRSNSILASYGVLGGGLANRIAPGARWSTIAGGFRNDIGTNSSASVIAGGERNTIATDSAASTIAGGWLNDIRTNAYYSFIGGGLDNEIAPDASTSTIGGGEVNVIGTDSDHSVIGGGWDNGIGANSESSAIGGGYNNNIGTNSAYSAIGGGEDNNIATNAVYATIPGGRSNVATNYAFAAGRRAKANHTGAFVWADSTDANVASTGNNQFIVRAAGGIWLGTSSSPGIPAGRFLNTSTGGYLSTGGAWTDSSDRNAKENFQPVDGRSILERVAQLPITTWNYKTEDAAVRHVGPVAQDFHAAFQVGPDDQHLAALDANGVALAAIQGLNRKVEEQMEENVRLKQRLANLEQLLAKLTQSPD